MASTEQLRANKANAQKSTGPRTQAGKQRSRLNARKHGLTAKLLVIGNEDPAEFDELRAALMEQYDPQGPAECELIEYLASMYWRLRRVPFFEAAIFAARQARVAEEDASRAQYDVEDEAETKDAVEEQGMSDAAWLVHVGRILTRHGIWADELGKLTRYEATLLNKLAKTMTLLDEISVKRQSRLPTLNFTSLPSAA
jgi:hypothetical protein